MKSWINIGRAILLAGTAGLAVSSASAQTMPSAAPEAAAQTSDSSGDGSGLGDIVVTAQRTQSTAQKTPVAITVLTADTLTRNGVGSLQDIAAFSPSIKFAQNQAAAVITIRGVSSRDDSEVGDPAVAVSTDGFYVNRPVGLTATMFDLDRVEVLRGPQGTLYGRNATGGAINIITAKPTDVLEGRVSAEYGNYNALNFEGMVNIPLSDTLAIRASFSARDRDGYRKLTPAADGDDEDSQAVRLHVQYTPTDRLKFLLTGEYLKQGGVGSVGVGIPYVPAADGSNSLLKPSIPGNDTVFDVDTTGYTNIETKTVKGSISYRFDPFTLSYNGGYSEMEFHRQADLDGTAAFHDGFQQNENPRTQNHEIRVASNGGESFNWQAGVFRFKEVNALNSFLQTFSGNGTFNWGIFDFPRIVATSNAVFGQANYKVTDRVTVEGGIRYTKDEKSRVGTITFFGSGSPDDERSKTDAVTWHGALLFQATPRNLLYAKVDRGYKAGGFNNGSSYEPEFLTAYEVGSKNRFLDNALEINLSAFYYDYTNQQVKQFVDTVEREIITNAGTSTIWGAEFEGVYAPTTADRFDFSVSYLHSEYDTLRVSNGTGSNLDLSGNKSPQAPKWSLSGGFQHRFDLGAGSLTARVQSRYETASYLTIYNDPRDRQKPYTKSDASITYAPTNGAWTLQAFVRNIEDRTVINLVADGNSYGVNYYQFAAPRTFGGRLSVKF